MLALLTKLADDAPDVRGRRTEVEVHYAPVLRRARHFTHKQRAVAHPRDLGDDAVGWRLSPVPAQLQRGALCDCCPIRPTAELTNDIEVLVQLEYVYRYERVVVSWFGVLHNDGFWVGHDGVRVLGWVVHREGVLVHGGFVKAEERNLRSVGCPPERIIGGENLLLVDPIRDSMEEGCIP